MALGDLRKNAGVVDEYIELAEHLDGARDASGRVLLLRKVAGKRLGDPAVTRCSRSAQ